MLTTNTKQDAKLAPTPEVDAALELLEELVDLRFANELQPPAAQTVYTPSVVVWMLVTQRLHKDCTLEETVKLLLDRRPDLLPPNKRVDEQKLSTSSGAYSGGRQRLEQGTVDWLCETVSQSIIETTSPTFEGRRVFALDGTTISLGPEWDLRDVFPPAENQYGESPWPIALMVVAHEVETGAALPPEIGAMYGDEAVSETRLIDQHLQRIPDGSIIVADSAYGICRVAQAISQSGSSFVLRMTKTRFRRLRKDAELIEKGTGWKTYRTTWTPSARELRDNPDLPADFALDVWLHEYKTDQGETIYLVSDMTSDVDTAAELYCTRWRVETDLSHLKLTLDIENIRAKSKEMFYKELMTSMVAYNLTIQFRRQAAEIAEVPPRRLSFKGVWDTLRISLLDKNFATAEAWANAYERALQQASKQKLPNRPDRSYPRQAYKRRPKSTHFEKRIPPWNRAENEPK